MTTGIATPWRNRIVGTGEEAPDQLLANPQNWRTHPNCIVWIRPPNQNPNW